MTTLKETTSSWPRLAGAGWDETQPSLHRWSQIVGKLRLALSPPLNHYWHVPLYVSTRGLTTSPMPYGAELFECEFDFLAHQLRIVTSWNQSRSIPLRPTSVAEMYADITAALRALEIAVPIWTRPVEIEDPIRFELDHAARGYDADAAHAFWRALVHTDRVFKVFRGGFLGKASPVHFFWGGFDMAVTRFSGRRAPMWDGPTLNVKPHVMHESYSHEVSSAGLWLGNAGGPPQFYSYAVPEPPGYRDAAVPNGATYSQQFGEFLLPYDVVQSADQPDELLSQFLQATYDAAATLGGWDRELLEHRPPCLCEVRKA
jgi:Family of unknown function (DUF5996)